MFVYVCSFPQKRTPVFLLVIFRDEEFTLLLAIGPCTTNCVIPRELVSCPAFDGQKHIRRGGLNPRPLSRHDFVVTVNRSFSCFVVCFGSLCVLVRMRGALEVWTARNKKGVQKVAGFARGVEKIPPERAPRATYLFSASLAIREGEYL